MSSPEFIPNIFQMMKKNPSLAGSFELAEGCDEITWNLFEGYVIKIAEDYIGIDRMLFGKIPSALTHWHPSDDELYEDICNLGTKGNVTVIHKSILGESVLYSGEKSSCHYKRKWLFGRYIYLYA